MASDATGPKGTAKPPSSHALTRELLHTNEASQLFRHKLEDLAKEHDNETARLLNLVRDLHSENLELKNRLQDANMTAASSRQEIGSPPLLDEDCFMVPASEAAGPLQESSVETHGKAAVDAEARGTAEESTVETLGKAAVDEEGDKLDNRQIMSPAAAKFVSNRESFTSSFSLGTEKTTSFVQSPKFELVVGSFILLNTVVMMIELQFQGLEAGYDTQFPGIGVSVEETAPAVSTVFKVVERIFVVLFTVELFIRLAVERFTFLTIPLNWIDVVAVIVGILEWALDQFPVNPIVVRLFRLLRFTRGVRFLKLSKTLDVLNFLMKCIRGSLSTLMWSLCLIVLVQCIVGMVACQIVQGYILDLSNPERQRHELYDYFGTFSRSFVTMFEIHLANWITPCRVIMRTLGELYGWFFVIYRCVVGFSVINVISAVFIQQTMTVAQNDQDIMILQKQRATERYKSKLTALFKALDDNDDSELSREEFEKMATDPSLKAWMGALDIDAGDLEGLFDLIDTGDGRISVEEFIVGGQRLKGTAKNIDMAHLLVTVARIEGNVSRLEGNVSQLCQKQQHHVLVSEATTIHI